MKRILLFIFATMLAGQAFAKENYDFSATCNSGQTLYYKITSSIEPYTVAVTYPNYNSSSDYYYGYTKPSGELIIPSKVLYLGDEYSVANIGVHAFNGCSGLTSITIPNSVTTIHNSAFRNCNNLTQIIIPNSVVYIDQYAFGCPITNMTIPFAGNYVQSHGQSYVPMSVENIIITGGSSIPEKSFYNYKNLYSIKIPSSVTSIGNYAFSGCSELCSVTLPESVAIIGNYAFSNCGELRSIVIPKSVTSIGINAFRNCSGLTTVTIPNSNSVTSIGNFAFWGCSGLTSITIPNSVTSIGNGAFINCTGLKSAIISESVTCIGKEAFLNCNNLTSIEIPNSVTSIGKLAFSGCDNLNYNRYDNADYYGSTENPYYALIRFSNTAICEINANCKVIADEAFISCQNLTSVFISESVTNIGKSAFNSCTNITSIEIPNSVVNIDEYAFSNCGGLRSVIIGNSVKYIGDYVFNNCTKLNSISISNSVNKIGKYAFNNCAKMSSITMGDSITNIDKGAFYGCSGLTTITISNAVSSIEDSVFSNCTNLKSITIGKSVTSINASAFNGCTSLKKIICLASVPPSITEDPIPNTDSVFVPSASVDVYKKTPIWKRKIILPIIAAESANTTQGSVIVDNDANSDNTVIITATSAEHYHFVGWSDGNTENPRTMPANAIVKLTAMFEVDECAVIVSANSSTFGYVTGSGSYYYGGTATFTATPAKGYHFVKWNDENTDNPRNYYVTNDVSLAAIFAGHTIVTDAAIAATCTTTGLSEGSHCSVCGEILVAQQTIPIGKHTVVIDDAVAATETSTGLTAGSHCSVCGKVIVAQTVIPALGENQGGNEGGQQGNGNQGNENQGGNNEGNENQGGMGNQGGNEQGNEKHGGENNNPSTAVAETAANAINIYAHDNTIIVENATEEIRVYDAMGRMIGRDATPCVRAEMNVNATGVYIVKVGNVAKRVVVN